MNKYSMLYADSDSPSAQNLKETKHIESPDWLNSKSSIWIGRKRKKIHIRHIDGDKKIVEMRQEKLHPLLHRRTMPYSP